MASAPLPQGEVLPVPVVIALLTAGSPAGACWGKQVAREAVPGCLPGDRPSWGVALAMGWMPQAEKG